MSKKDNFYFRTEKFQKLVIQSIAQCGTILRFASKIGIDGSDFNSKTGINAERWKNPTAESLAKIAIYYDLPLDYFFTDDIDFETAEKECQQCAEKERIIESKQQTIDAQQLAIDSLRQQVTLLQKKRCHKSERCIYFTNRIKLMP